MSIGLYGASLDLTTLEHFLYVPVKDKCNANDPETIQDFEAEIHAAAAKIRLQNIWKCIQKWDWSYGILPS